MSAASVGAGGSRGGAAGAAGAGAAGAGALGRGGSTGAAAGANTVSTLLSVTATPFAMFAPAPLNRDSDYTTTAATAARLYGTAHVTAATAAALALSSSAAAADAAADASAQAAATAADAAVVLPGVRPAGPGTALGPAAGVFPALLDPTIAVGATVGSGGWDAYGEKADLTALARVAAVGAGPRSQSVAALAAGGSAGMDQEWDEVGQVYATPGTGEYGEAFVRTKYVKTKQQYATK